MKINENTNNLGANDVQSAIELLKQEAVTLMDCFEVETTVTIKFIDCKDRFWGLVRTDDDCAPAILWTEGYGDKWFVRSIWLDEEIAKELRKFCLPEE